MGKRYIYRKLIGLNEDGTPYEETPFVVTFDSMIQGFYHCFNGDRMVAENQITASRSELSEIPDGWFTLGTLICERSEKHDNKKGYVVIADTSKDSSRSLKERFHLAELIASVPLLLKENEELKTQNTELQKMLQITLHRKPRLAIVNERDKLKEYNNQLLTVAHDSEQRTIDLQSENEKLRAALIRAKERINYDNQTESEYCKSVLREIEEALSTSDKTK